MSYHKRRRVRTLLRAFCLCFRIALPLSITALLYTCLWTWTAGIRENPFHTDESFRNYKETSWKKRTHAKSSEFYQLSLILKCLRYTNERRPRNWMRKVGIQSDGQIFFCLYALKKWPAFASFFWSRAVSNWACNGIRMIFGNSAEAMCGSFFALPQTFFSISLLWFLQVSVKKIVFEDFHLKHWTMN